MARPRVYRHQARCPECGSNWMPKDGHSKGRQVYHCGDCSRHYIPEAAYHRPSAANKEHAMAMYLEGSSLRAIGRVFGVSAQAASVWCGSKRGGARRAVPDGAAERTAQPLCCRHSAGGGDCLG